MPILSNAALANSFTNTIANETLLLLRGNQFLSQFIGTPEEYGAPFSSVGNTVDFLLDPVFAAQNARVDNTERTYSTPTQNRVRLELDYHREVAPFFTDIDKVLANPVTTINTYSRAAAMALSADIERQLLLIAVNDADIPVGNEVGTVGVALNYKALVRARTVLAKMGVPDTDERILMLPPDKYEELLMDPKVTEYQVTGDGDSIRSGRMMKIAGFTIYETNYMPTNLAATSVAGVGTDILGVAMTRSALVMGSRPLSDEMLGNGIARTVTDGGYSLRFRMFNDPQLNQQKMVFDILYGAKVMGRPSLADGLVKFPILPILGGLA